MSLYLFTRRRRYVSPFRLLEALAPLLYEAVELLDGLGVLTGDHRWSEEAERLRRARDLFMKPSKAAKRLADAVHAAARADDLLANLDKNPLLAEILRSRKPMASIRPAPAKVLVEKPRLRPMAWILDPQRAVAVTPPRRRRGR